MTDENQGDDPSGDPNEQIDSSSSASPTAPQQHKMRNDSDSRCEDEKNKAIHLEEDIRTGERWLIGISAASIILNAVIALIYFGQLKQMRISTQAAESAANTAAQTLKEIRASSTDTHELAVQAKNQADRTKDIANRALIQASATNKLVELSQKTFEAAERPYIGVNESSMIFLPEMMPGNLCSLSSPLLRLKL
jgi:hypothetical protein